MSPEVRGREPFYGPVISANPFDHANIFYNALIRMDWPIKLVPGDENDELQVEVREMGVAASAQRVYDRIYYSNVFALIRSVDEGASNRILLLLEGDDDGFCHEENVNKRFSLEQEELEMCFVRAYDIFQEHLEKYPEGKKTDFPKPEDKAMYEKLKKKNVSPISASRLQGMLVRVI